MNSFLDLIMMNHRVVFQCDLIISLQFIHASNDPIIKALSLLQSATVVNKGHALDRSVI